MSMPHVCYLLTFTQPGAVQTITDFAMYIDNTQEFARLVYNACPPNSWKQIHVWGLVASLEGDSCFLFQAGWWHITSYGTDFHYEAMEFHGVVGMAQETSLSWHNGCVNYFDALCLLSHNKTPVKSQSCDYRQKSTFTHSRSHMNFTREHGTRSFKAGQ